MAITFDRDTQTASFHSPLEDFELVDIDVEVRTDPLTGRQSRIVPQSFAVPADDPDIEEYVTDAEGCFFCPDLVRDATPKYPDTIGTDRGGIGEAVSFPNLNPYGAYSNVVVVTEEHYVPIDRFTPEQLANGLSAALEYVTAVFSTDDATEYASVNMNFLPAAGSSIVHPHMQTLIDDRGTNHGRELTAGARTYYDGSDSPYWTDLIEAERDGERWIGSTGTVDWLASFSPKHHRHILGVIENVTVPAPGSREVTDLATGITSVLEYYGSLGLNSFNFVFHLVEDEPACPPVLSIVARSVFGRYYWSDSPFFVSLHDEGVVDAAPEEYAAEAKTYF